MKKGGGPIFHTSSNRRH